MSVDVIASQKEKAKTAVLSFPPAPLSSSAAASPFARAGVLPRWVCLALALLCGGLGAWASVVTLGYFEYGARALESDEAARSLAGATSMLLVVLEMAAFGVAAMLPPQRLRAQRWSLAALAAAVLAFECLTIVLVQQGITRTADVSADARQAQMHTLQASIAALRATAEELRNAAAASSQSKVLASRQSAAESLAAALDAERQAQARGAELAALQAGQRPTATQILGQQGALAYAVTRGLLVSVAGLVLFGAAGSLLRAAGEGAAGEDVSVADAAVSVSGVSGGVSDTSEPVSGVSDVSKAAGPVPLAHFAWTAGTPALGTVAPASVSLVPLSVRALTWNDQEAASASAGGVFDGAVSGVSVPVSGGVSVDTADTVADTGAADAEAVPAGDDEAEAAASGSLADEDARLARVRAGVRDGSIAPSIRGVQAAVRCGAPMVRRYLAQLEAEGVIRRDGKGFVRVESAVREPALAEA